LATLRRHGLGAGDIELEITESSAMEYAEVVRAALRELTEAGVALAIDDFGTGYSSFAALPHVSPTSLKIDQSFIAQLLAEPSSVPIVQAILAMAASLGLTVTAEGVETEEQLRLLRRMGCAQVQGFHLSRPLSAEQFRRL